MGQQWESTTSSSSSIATTLQAKACANVEGPTDGDGWSVRACAAYSSAEKREAIRTESNSVRVILGGTRESRAGITLDLNKTTLDKFIVDAEKGDQPIDFVFK